MDQINRRVLRGVQYAVALVAFSWVLTRVDWGRLGSLLATLSPPTVAALLAATAGGLVCRFYLWAVLVRPTTPAGLREAGYVDLTVNLVNQFLPSRLSGRSVSPIVVRHWFRLHWSEAVGIAGAHTALYALLYGIASVVGLFAIGNRVTAPVLVLVGASALTYLLIGVIMVYVGSHLEAAERLADRLGSVMALVPVAAVRDIPVQALLTRFAGETADAFRLLVGDGKVVRRYALAWVGVVLLAPAVRVWLLLGAFGGNLEVAALLPLYLVTAYSVTLLPVTPGGIGITEASATLVFVSLGVAETVIVPVVLLDRVLGVYAPALAGIYPAARLDLTREAPD